ncbi:autotransporter-associated beta strand repeat-containing protein, partial [Bombella sp. TMW 2.2543]
TLTKGGTLTLTNAGDSYNGALSGEGGLTIAGGTETLTGDNTYKGQTLVEKGAQLTVNGNNQNATGLTSVTQGATLRGAGTIGGDVSIGAGATFAPGTESTPGSLNIHGNLTLDDHSTQVFRLGQTDTEGGKYNDFVNVAGDLKLGGTLSIQPMEQGPDAQNSALTPGVYRLYSYAGSLNGTQQQINLTQGTGSNLQLQTSMDNQVNLVTDAHDFIFWDGDAASNRSERGIGNNKIDGGDGVWQAASNHGISSWTKADGKYNSQWQNGNMAIFGGTNAGVVRVSDKTADGTDSPVSFSAIQFVPTKNGGTYLITGDNLYASTDDTIIRVGSAEADSNLTAEIASVIDGSKVDGGTSLHKTDAGTLILSSDNQFARATQIDGGTLQLGNGGTTGSVGTADIINKGRLVIDHSNDVTLSQAISGTGSFVQQGTGTTTLSGANSYTGDTDVLNGRLNILSSIGGNLNNYATTKIDGGHVVGTTTNNGTLTAQNGTLATLLNQAGSAKLTDSSVGNVINKAGFTLINSALNGTLGNEGTADIEGSKVADTTTNNGTLIVKKSALAGLFNQTGTAKLTDSSVGNVINKAGFTLTNSALNGTLGNEGTAG